MAENEEDNTASDVAAVIDGIALGAGLIPGAAGVAVGGILRLVAGVVRSVGPGKAEAAIRALEAKLADKPGISREELDSDRAKVLAGLGIEE